MIIHREGTSDDDIKNYNYYSKPIIRQIYYNTISVDFLIIQLDSSSLYSAFL